MKKSIPAPPKAQIIDQRQLSAQRKKKDQNKKLKNFKFKLLYKKLEIIENKKIKKQGRKCLILKKLYQKSKTKKPIKIITNIKPKGHPNRRVLKDINKEKKLQLDKKVKETF